MKGRADDAGPQDYEAALPPVTEKVLGIIEEAGAPQVICDRVAKVIEEWEYAELASEEPHNQIPCPDDDPTSPAT